MSDETSPVSLSPRLAAVLQALPEPQLAERLRRVYLAAARAIGRLSDIDLLKYEPQTVDTTADLSLWEEMAPVVRDTVMDVNALLGAIRTQFPPGEPSTLPMSNPLARRAREAVTVLHGAMGEMTQELAQIGEAMRKPEVVSDRWNLLSEVQRVRTRFRQQIGDLVFHSATVFGEVSRSAIVPGYDEELRSAVALRAIVSDLARVVAARGQKVREAEPEDIQWNAQGLKNELDAFGRTSAYRALRAQDKRHVLEARARVGRLAEQSSPHKGELQEVVGQLEAFVTELASVNRREILVDHDREMLASCGVRLERAMSQLDRDAPAAARALAEAAASAQSLYGKDAPLDVFLRRARKASLAHLEGDALRTTMEEFQGLLANLMVQ